MSGSNCCVLTCIQISQEAGKMVRYSHLLKNFPQFVVIHTVKVFGIVNKAEVNIFLELSCFFYDPVNVEHLEQYLANSRTSLNVYWVNQQMNTWINNLGLSSLGPDCHLWISLNRVHLNPWIKLDWGVVSLVEDKGRRRLWPTPHPTSAQWWRKLMRSLWRVLSFV